MKFEYKNRFKHELLFSDKQLEEMSALHCINWFMSSRHLKDIPNVNPDWLEQQRYKNFSVYHIEELKKKGFWDNGRIKIRRAKKGYVLEMKFNWRSKKLKTFPVSCIKCNKIKKLNWHQFCEDCTKEVGGHKGIIKLSKR